MVATWAFSRSRQRQAILDKFRYFELARKPFIIGLIKSNRPAERVLLSRSRSSGSKPEH